MFHIIMSTNLLQGFTDNYIERGNQNAPGGFSHWHGIRICACRLGHFFAKFGIAIGGFSTETKEPKLHKLGVFWANYCKKHPIWSKLGAFLSKMVYWWVGNLAKNWYRDSQIFEVRQAHPRTILVKETPPGQNGTISNTRRNYLCGAYEFPGELKHPCHHDAQNDSEVRKITHNFSIKKLISQQPFILFFPSKFNKKIFVSFI